MRDSLEASPSKFWCRASPSVRSPILVTSASNSIVLFMRLCFLFCFKFFSSDLIWKNVEHTDEFFLDFLNNRFRAIPTTDVSGTASAVPRPREPFEVARNRIRNFSFAAAAEDSDELPGDPGPLPGLSSFVPLPEELWGTWLLDLARPSPPLADYNLRTCSSSFNMYCASSLIFSCSGVILDRLLMSKVVIVKVFGV